jgi:putative ABC transport system permease protein
VRSWLTSWRLALRLARRDLLKHRARAVIALVMVTLPVLAVIAADVLIQTADVSPTEGIDRRLGTVATAEVRIADGQMEVVQGADPMAEWGGGAALDRPTTLADIERVIGHRSTLAAPDQSELLVRTAHGREPVESTQLDATAPLAHGLYRLTAGRWPSGTDEVVVNQALRDRGVGGTLTVYGRDRTESTRRIVGTVVDPALRGRGVVVGLPGSLPKPVDDALDDGWLVDGPPITWAQVQQLNRIGVLVTDRQIASHPGDYPSLSSDSGVSGTTVQVAALIVVMALIEVVLLAGPAFAVGARKQQRSLALLVSSGGTPAQARRVIIAGGVLLGLSAAVVGVVGGIGLGWLLRPLVQQFQQTWLGPFEVPWPHLAAVAAFGLVSALVACVVPAWIASRQNVVAVLAGRRGDAKPVRAFPVVGLVLFGIGVLMAVAGAAGRGGDLTVAWSAVVCVLGMVLLVPVVVSWVARAAGRFPLAVRFAARDAVRHRTRTTPAVAAVAATVAGVVALGIATSSDAEQNRETYQPSLLMGDASVMPQYDYYVGTDRPTDWDRLVDVVGRHAPAASVVRVTGLGDPTPSSTWTDVSFSAPGRSVDDDPISPYTIGSTLGTDILVSDGEALPSLVAAAVPVAEVRRALAAGRAVVFTSDSGETALDRVDLHARTEQESGDESEDRTTAVPALVLYSDPDGEVPVRAILPPALAAKAGLPSTTVALELHHPHLSEAAEKDLDAALEALPTPASVHVERGYQPPTADAILQWVLAALGAVLMIGGTLTAMFLALSDARPDLATLAAVGAAARVRRSVAAAYTFVVAFVGAVLGMLVGFVPGVAITWPLTDTASGSSHGAYLDIPWLMIAVVVLGLPVLTALVVGLCVRSRLPMVARLG